MVPDGDGGCCALPARPPASCREVSRRLIDADRADARQARRRPEFASASVRNLGVLDTPVGAIGVVIPRTRGCLT